MIRLSSPKRLKHLMEDSARTPARPKTALLLINTGSPEAPV